MTVADLLALALYAAARETLETQAGAKRIRAGYPGNAITMRNRINVWAHRVREGMES